MIKTAAPPGRIGGWLLVYIVAQILLLFHGLGLTLATIIVSSDPSLVGMTTFVPASHVVFYTATNVLLAVYILVVVRLITCHRRIAIVHNACYCVLSIVFVVAWHVLGMKSTLGTVIDSLPGMVGIAYFSTSTRVKQTLTKSTAAA